MAVVDQYTSRVLGQGQVESRANGNDFGAQVGAAQQNMGDAVIGVGQALYQREIENETTKVHVDLAKSRADIQQMTVDEVNKAQPGDDKLVSRIGDNIDKYFEGKGDQFSTRHGQELYARMTSDMKAGYMVNAVEQQARLDGVAAQNDHKQLVDNLTTVAAQDFSQTKGLIAQGLAAIDDKNGVYSRIPEPAREALRRDLTNSINFEAAKGYARRYPNAVLGVVEQHAPEVAQAVKKAVANPPAPGVVPDLKAPLVKPYDPSRLEQLAKKVATPSPYDQYFEDAGRLYGIDPKELKMRATAESGLDPRVVNPQGAGGIMQFTDATAKQWGVTDRLDPKQAILGAAKMLASYRSKANGDMAVVDQMYYGGEAGTAWGPNTKQYAANLSALRQSVGLGASTPPEAFAPNASVQLASNTPGMPESAGTAPGVAAAGGEFKKPKTGIDVIDNLPAKQFFDVLTEAEHYQRAFDAQSERARMESERRKKEAQGHAMDSYMSRIITPNETNGGAPSELQIMQDRTLEWEQKQHLIDYRMRREREIASGAESKSNPAEVRSLMLQVHAADDDPRKSYNMDPVMSSYKAGKISTNEMVFLRGEVEKLKDGTTSGFQKDVQSARNAVYTSLTRSILGQVQPEVAADAAYRFNQDMEAQIANLRKQNKDPRTLLDPSSRDYLLKPERIQSFMPHGATGAAAAQTAQAQAAGLPTYQQYDSLKPGASYTDPQGNVRVKGK